MQTSHKGGGVCVHSRLIKICAAIYICDKHGESLCVEIINMDCRNILVKALCR